MAKARKPQRSVQVGDNVTLLVETGPFMAGTTGTVSEFRTAHDGQQAYLEIGGDGMWIWMTDIALVIE